MAVKTSSNIVTDNLLFHIDMNNRKSYRGPPLTNKFLGLSPSSSTGTGLVMTSGTETVNIPGFGDSLVNNCFLQNTGSASCCISFMNFGGTGNTLLSSTTYTYFILYRVDSGYTHPNFMYRYEYTSAGAYVTESGIFDTNKRVHLGGNWYYAWNTFTTSATTTSLVGYSFSYNYSSFTDKYSWARVCLVQGDYSTMPPKFWPELSETRSSTQTILDLTGNNTVTVNNLTYASSGTFSFNGSSSWLEMPTSSIFDIQALTMECWCKPTTTSQSGFLFEKGQVNTQYSNFFDSSGNFYFRTMGLSTQDLTFTSASYISTTNWNHIVCTYGSGTKSIYVNGNRIAQQTSLTGSIPTGQTNQYIGKYGSASNQYPFNGSIAVSRVYSRALTAAEVLQNFNARKGLYGV
jgi:hypothetical protein